MRGITNFQLHWEPPSLLVYLLSLCVLLHTSFHGWVSSAYLQLLPSNSSLTTANQHYHSGLLSGPILPHDPSHSIPTTLLSNLSETNLTQGACRASHTSHGQCPQKVHPWVQCPYRGPSAVADELGIKVRTSKAWLAPLLFHGRVCGKAGISSHKPQSTYISQHYSETKPS